MRYNVRRWLACAVGAVLVGTATVGLSASLGTFEPVGSVPMTLGQWQAERASQGEEDEPGWDCRVQGNGQCGTVWWELVCPAGEQTADTLCALEPHSVFGTPFE